MKLTILSFVASLSLFLFAACGGGGNSTTSELKTVYADLTEVLKGIDDVDSAKAAKSEIEPLMERVNKLTKEAADKATDGDYEVDPDEAKEFTEISAAYSKELTRVLANKEWVAELGDTLTQK